MGEASLVTVTGTGMTGHVQRFASSGDGEEETIDWKIDNVADFLEMSNEELRKTGVVFQAGNCILNDGTRARATWNYCLEHFEENEEEWIGGWLYLQNGTSKSKVKSAKALQRVSLSSGGVSISCFTTERKDYANMLGWGMNKMVKKAKILEKTKATDTLEVSLKLKVFSSQGFKPILQAISSSPLASELKGDANADFVKMLESGDGADVQIKVPKEAGGEVDGTSYTKMVHKCVLMTRSSVFSKMFAKESDMVEAKNGKVVIKDLSPKGLRVFLHYLYTGEVLSDWTEVFEEIINAAEKYDCGKLKQYCGHNLLSAVTTGNALKMYKFAKLHSLSFAAKGVLEFISKNAEAVIVQGADADNEGNE